MSTARLLLAIVAGAALLFAALWWRARPEPPVPVAAPVEVPLRVPAAAPAPVAAGAPVRRSAAPEPLVDATAMARGEIRQFFADVRLPRELEVALAEGRVAEVVERLLGTPGGDATVALERVLGFCGAARGIASAEFAPAALADGGASLAPAVAAGLAATVRGQRAWAERLGAACERAGTNANELRGRVSARIVVCAREGHADCVHRWATIELRRTPRYVPRLLAAATFGSRAAMADAIAALQAEDPVRHAEALAYWRTALARLDPDFRALRAGCVGDDCARRASDEDLVLRELLGALREGSGVALATLATPPGRLPATVARGGAPGAPDPAAPGAGGGSTPAPLQPLSNPSATDAYAWSVVAERLALAGCFGFWPNWAAFVGAPAQAERALSPAQAVEARAAAEGRWQAYGATLAAARGCEVDRAR